MQLFDEKEVSKLLHVSTSTLRNFRRLRMRGENKGPKFVKLDGRLVRYRLRDLEEYLAKSETQIDGA